jgi:hypothetical protein
MSSPNKIELTNSPIHTVDNDMVNIMFISYIFLLLIF